MTVTSTSQTALLGAGVCSVTWSLPLRALIVSEADVDEQQLGPGIDRDGEVLHAIGARMRAGVTGDDRDRIRPIGAVDHGRTAAA